MDDQYYKARIGELEREVEAANVLSEHLYAENIRLTADIKMLEEREQNVERDFQNLIKEGDLQWRTPDCKIIDDEQKLWELYRDANSLGMKPQSAMNAASWALKVWKKRER